MHDATAPDFPADVPPGVPVSDDAPPAPIVDFVDATPPPPRPWATLASALAVGISYVMAQSVVVVCYLGARLFQGRPPDPDELAEKFMHNGTLLSIVGIAGAAASVPLTLLFGRILGHGSWNRTLGLQPTSLGAVLRWTLAIVALAATIDLINWNAGGEVTVPFMVDAYRTANPPALLALMLVVAAPLSEELLFRGLLFGGLAGTRLGVVGTVLFTSVVFAAMHVQYDLPNIAVVGLFGICLGIARAHWLDLSLLRDARRAERPGLRPDGLSFVGHEAVDLDFTIRGRPAWRSLSGRRVKRCNATSGPRKFSKACSRRSFARQPVPTLTPTRTCGMSLTIRVRLTVV